MNAIHGLAQKKDVSAIDLLIRKFSCPDPLYWNSSVFAVGQLARHGDAPEEARAEMFSKLSGLLDHEDSTVRPAAAAALGGLGTEAAFKQVMPLLDAPAPRCRRMAVFILGARG